MMAANMPAMKANCAIDEINCSVAYDRLSFPELKKSDFHFEIVPSGGDFERFEYKMFKNGQLVRYHNSKHFMPGLIELRGKPSLNSASFVLRFKKNVESVQLADIFGGP